MSTSDEENAEQIKEYEAQKFFTRASLTTFPTKKGVNISSETSPFAKVRTKLYPPWELVLLICLYKTQEDMKHIIFI